MSLKTPKPARKTGVTLELPSNSSARLQDCDRSGLEEVSKSGLNDLIQGLIHIARDGVERTVHPRNLIMRV